MNTAIYCSLLKKSMFRLHFFVLLFVNILQNLSLSMILKKFLFFRQFQPRDSYKKDSFKIKRVYVSRAQEIFTIMKNLASLSAIFLQGMFKLIMSLYTS